VPRNAADQDRRESAASKSARTRERLLDAAAAVLARKGFSGTRLSDIAELAQLQTPAIYYYYPSREQLIEEVMYTGAAAMHQYLVAALDALPADSTPSDRIAAAIEAHLRNELQLSDYSHAIIRNANQLPPEINERALAEVTAYNEIWRALIEDLRAAGQLRPDITPALARMLILGALNWATEWWRPDQGAIEPLIATAQSMLLHSLRR
jgi:AcrR family transcriptional regulator